MGARRTVNGWVVAVSVAAALALAAAAVLARRAMPDEGGPLASASWRAPTAPPRVVAPAAASATAAALEALRVSSVSGAVERRLAGEGWSSVAANAVLPAGASLRTGAGGAAVLELRERATVWLWPDSEVSVDVLSQQLSSVGLAVGRAELAVREASGSRFEVRTPDGVRAQAERAARFSIIVDGAHVATVATREGEVSVLSGDRRVRVPPGVQVRAQPGQPLDDPEPIPTELLLSVAWPEAPLTSREVSVRGRAPVGVLVSVHGARVLVRPDGTFEGRVRLPEGQDALEVRAQDVLGREVVRRSPPLRVESAAGPRLRVRGGWE